MVIGEAMASACPVIATTHTGASELITDGIDGFIVPVRSPDSIVECLQRLADEPFLRQQIGSAAADKIRALGGWDRYGQDWESQINKFLKINDNLSLHASN